MNQDDFTPKTWSLMRLSNYLFFTTDCEAALGFYTACGLGTVVALLRYGENGMPVPTPAMRGRVMHAVFEGPGILFYASDNHDAEPMRGSAHILMMGDSHETRTLFETTEPGGHRYDVPRSSALG